jgi:hypothetical protein
MKKRDSLIDNLNHITGGGGGGCWRKYTYSFCWQQEVEKHLNNNKNGKICAKLVACTENDKHDNHEIIKIENTQENAEKHQIHEEMRYIL